MGIFPFKEPQLSHISGQTMTNTMMHEWSPRVYLSIVGVAIHNYIMQHNGVLSGKSKDHIYSYPVMDIMLDNLATSILYPFVHMSCGQTI